MTDLLLHETTAYQLQALTGSPPHAVLISGPAGAGKQTIGLHIANQVLGVADVQLHPYFLVITPEKQHLSIDDIRKLKDFLGKKTTGTATIRRIVLIPDAHTMTNDAQNALLKTLEEPPADTVLLLTTSDITALKPTIRSRSQHLHVLPVSNQQAVNYYTKQGFDTAHIQKAFSISNGHVGLLAALLQNQHDHPLVQAIDLAKQLLTATKYDRLLKVEELSKDKVQCSAVLQGLGRIISSGLSQATAQGNHTQVKRFYAISVTIMAASEQFKQNVNPKLLLTNLFLEM